MKNRLPCEDVEALIFELHRGELSDLKRAAVDEHLHSCHRCRELATRIDEVFDTAAEADAETWADIASDELFSNIEAAIDDGPSVEASDPNIRLDETFEVARTADKETWEPFDSDALFDRISQQMSTPEGAHPTQEDHEPKPLSVSDNDEKRSNATKTRAWPRTLIGLAAAACAALLVWSITAGDDAPAEPEIVELAEPKKDIESATIVATEEIVTEEPPASSPLELPTLHPASSNRDSVRLFASDDADFSADVDDDNEDSTILLKSGSILVEYLPGTDTEFSVQVRSHTITVVGTVFFVSIENDKPRVAVFEGAVRVTSPDDSTREIQSGEYLDDNDHGVLSDIITSQVENYIELEEHRRTLQREASKAAHREPITEEPVDEEPVNEAPVDEKPADKEQPTEEAPQIAMTDESSSPEAAVEELTPDSSRALREQALEAQHRGEHRQARIFLERALEKTGPTDRATADILLELARIHLRELDEPRRAADHLSTFLNHWPDDPVAEAIRDQLCSMTAVAASEQEICE